MIGTHLKVFECWLISAGLSPTTSLADGADELRMLQMSDQFVCLNLRYGCLTNYLPFFLCLKFLLAQVIDVVS